VQAVWTWHYPQQWMHMHTMCLFAVQHGLFQLWRLGPIVFLQHPAPQLGNSAASPAAAAAAAAVAGGLQAHPSIKPTLLAKPVVLGPWQSWRRS
jgi:hypothetical protein